MDSPLDPNTGRVIKDFLLSTGDPVEALFLYSKEDPSVFYRWLEKYLEEDPMMIVILRRTVKPWVLEPNGANARRYSLLNPTVLGSVYYTGPILFTPGVRLVIPEDARLEKLWTAALSPNSHPIPDWNEEPNLTYLEAKDYVDKVLRALQWTLMK